MTAPYHATAASTEWQRRFASEMEMERRYLAGTGGRPKGRIAAALNAAWHYRSTAMAPSASKGDRHFWLRLARSAVSRAREDRTKTQPAERRMLALADACVERTRELVRTMEAAL